ncbi:MAG: hypothetical protein KatS3mg068_2591 [Candidatus Sericytochromatia bacterium]|nr:MAG: hypothetical protein KatS3mg068_2591 [Candidatus Sericytochromatia bacterium]
MSDINISYNNVSSKFLDELKKASADKKITNDEIKNLLNKVETEDDIEIVRDFTSFDKQKVNMNIRSGSSQENFQLDIEENNLETDENDNIKETIRSSTGKEITIRYAKDETTIPPSKQVKGTIEEANQKMDSILSPDKKAEWNRINKHNVNEVKSFINSLNLPMDKKAEFVQAYLTANYNHPGIDISWSGADLQEGINAVPTDKNGRKYLDCEAYAKLATELLDGSAKYYGVHAPSPYDSSDSRNHQVSVVRDGNNAYVISNNEITKISNASNKSDSQLIKSVYPDISNIKLDKSGPMKSGVDEYNINQKITLDNGSEVTIKSIDEKKNIMKGKLKDTDGEEYNVIGTVDANTGRTNWKRDYQVGDKLKLDSDVIKLTQKIDDKNFKGKIGNIDVFIKIKDDGSFDWFQLYKKGDIIETPNGTLKINKVDNKNENFEGTFTRNDGITFNVKLRRGNDGLLHEVK